MENTVTVGDLFVGFLRDSLAPKGKEGAAGLELDAETQKKLLLLSQKHDLAHLVYVGADRGASFTDAAIKQQFRKTQLMAVTRYEQACYAYEEILEVLNKLRTPFVPLKGAIIRDYYPEPWMRTSCDIDILVKEEDLEKIAKALEEEKGYQREEEKGYHDISLYSPTGIHLEMHFSIQEDMENIDKLLGEVWSYCNPVTENAVEYRQTNEFLFFHSVAHLLYHFLMGGCGVRAVLDVWILSKNLSYDESVFKQMLEQCGITRFYEAIVGLASVWFGEKEHTDTTKSLEYYILKGGVYGNFENRMKVAGAKTGSKGKYIWRKIFCPYDEMKKRYPVLKKHKWLLPIFEVVRWVEAIFKGRTKNLRGQVEAIESTTEEEKTELKQLLEEIGV